MTKSPYPFIDASGEPEDALKEVVEFCREIARSREEDIGDFTNLQNIFIKGRKVGKIPANSSDTVGDRVGDFNYDAAYLYICVDNTGTAEWRRVATGSF